MSHIFETFDKQAERNRRMQETGPVQEKRGAHHGELSYLATDARACSEDPRQIFRPEIDSKVLDALIEVGRGDAKGE